MTGRPWVILGGGGAFALHTARHLLDRGYDVVGIGRNFLRPPAFSLGAERWDGFAYHALHVGHETDLILEALDKTQPQVIVNFAAQGEGAISWRHSWRFYQTNVMALVKLTEALWERPWFRHGDRRFVHIGSSEVYGSNSHRASEEGACRPSSPYSVSKLAFDQHLLAVRRVLKFPANIVRPSNCYCPGQLLHRIVPKAMVAGLTGRRLPLQGGAQEKSYLHAADLARAIRLIGERAPDGEIYNVGPDRPVSIEYLARACAGVLDLPFEQLVERAEQRPGEDSRYWLNCEKAGRDLGWRPEVGLEAGLETVKEWAEEHLDFLRDWPTTYSLRD